MKKRKEEEEERGRREEEKKKEREGKVPSYFAILGHDVLPIVPKPPL